MWEIKFTSTKTEGELTKVVFAITEAGAIRKLKKDDPNVDMVIKVIKKKKL